MGTAVPPHDGHGAFMHWAQGQLRDAGEARLFARMAERSGIAHRWSVIDPAEGAGTDGSLGAFYGTDAQIGTAARMAVYAQAAPALALDAIAALAAKADLAGITHLVVASCTGFVAPGIDQIIARRLGLAPAVERLLVGYMGCYAAVAALRSAHHIVRSVPQARVLVVTVELSSLHLQPGGTLESLLAQLQFGDGAAAALVTGDSGAGGLCLSKPFAHAVPDSDTLIEWRIGDTGFAMTLSGEVPRRIAALLASDAGRATLLPLPVQEVADWAVHAGGRSILDAVEQSLGLPAEALADSRAVLRDFGNMSSATLMFVLARKLATPRPGKGIALAFGPGLACEGLCYEAID
jgi:predicted naringenin-chalcone synthase